MSSSLRETWEAADSNPDFAEDLGYVHEPLTVVHVQEDSEQYILLPGEEEHLTDSEFIIASPDSVCELSDRR
ncbi:MAG: hypothetical protein ABEI98_12690 [Halorhabdus sp.]